MPVGTDLLSSRFLVTGYLVSPLSPVGSNHTSVSEPIVVDVRIGVLPSFYRSMELFVSGLRLWGRRRSDTGSDAAAGAGTGGRAALPIGRRRRPYGDEPGGRQRRHRRPPRLHPTAPTQSTRNPPNQEKLKSNEDSDCFSFCLKKNAEVCAALVDFLCVWIVDVLPAVAHKVNPVFQALHGTLRFTQRRSQSQRAESSRSVVDL